MRRVVVACVRAASAITLVLYNLATGRIGDEARSLHGDAVASGRGPRTGTRQPDRAGPRLEGERARLDHGRAAFCVEPAANVSSHAVAGAARRRGRRHEA